MLQFRILLRYSYLLFASALVFLNSCSTPVRVLDYWTSEDFRDYSEKNIVVAVKAANPDNRQLFESRIVSKMKGQGINAIPSDELLPEQVLTNLDDFLLANRMSLDSLGTRGVVFAAVKNIIISDKPGRQASAIRKEDPDNAPLSRTYILESRIIDLKRESEESLVGVNLVSITDPKSVDELVKRYSKVVAHHFKKSPSQ